MSAILQPPAVQPVFTDDPVWRMPVETYQALTASGILTENDPVELVEGILVFKMPADEIHNAVCAALGDLIRPLLDSKALSYREQATVTLSDGEPQPDGAIVEGSRHHFARLGRKPDANEILWIAEVSNTTLRTDRGIKMRSYARAGIATYWIVNLSSSVVEVFADPDPTQAQPAYTAMTAYKRGQRVPVVINGQAVGSIAVDELLP